MIIKKNNLKNKIVINLHTRRFDNFRNGLCGIDNKSYRRLRVCT